MRSVMNKNIVLLFISQAFAVVGNITVVAFAGLVGNMISGSMALATLPISLTVTGMALFTGPLSFFMQKYGRRAGFRLGGLLGAVGALLAAFAIYITNFWLFCFACTLMGCMQASGQYIRFAAAESVDAALAPKAISFVMLGSAAGAMVVPQLTAWFNAALDPYMYMGAFVLVILVALLWQGIFTLIDFTPHSSHEEDVDSGGDAAVAGRSIAEFLQMSAFRVAVVNAALGGAMMAFVMTATPLAMGICGFDSTVSTGVIRWHVLGMFLPGLFTGGLIIRFGVMPVLMVGQLLFVVSFLAALDDVALWNFNVALILLGVGWNFCFIGGTSLLTSLYRRKERAKVQALNETAIVGLSAFASFAAGLTLRFFGWEGVNQITFAILLVASLVTIHYALGQRKLSAQGAKD